jgi:hypothetical protein
MLTYPEIGIMTRYFFEADSVLGMPRSILHPEDLEKVLEQFVATPDFETQKTLGRKAQYLLADKYCSYTPLVITDKITAKYTKVKSEFPYTTGAAVGVWTFADPWMDK